MWICLPDGKAEAGLLLKLLKTLLFVDCKVSAHAVILMRVLTATSLTPPPEAKPSCPPPCPPPRAPPPSPPGDIHPQPVRVPR